MLVNILLGIALGLSMVWLVSMILNLITEKSCFAIIFISSMFITVVLMIVIISIK